VKAATLKASPAEARRFMRRANRLDHPFADIASALAHHGYVQIDPLNVCGRMHDHILRNRVQGYREGDLTRHMHGATAGAWLPPHERTAFEHHLPSSSNLVAFTTDVWPHLLASMRGRQKIRSAWSGRLTPREKAFAEAIFEKLKQGGPVAPEDFSDDRKGRQVWGAATLAKATLQKLFFHGRLLIAGRQQNRRLYDLPERILPAGILARVESPPAEVDRWLAHLRLRQHRLAILKKEELRLIGDLVQAVEVDGCPVLHCLREDAGLFEDIKSQEGGASPLLLAPLDPLIYDRRLTSLLWNFDYAWEVYTPAPKRKRGYYALPVLSGIELVGHVDLKADREKGRLRVLSKSVRRGHRAAPAVLSLERFLGLGPGRS
jgi:uncharacterized protein YcaQ